MNKTTEQLNADTLFAFQMALKGHNQFEWQSEVSGNWLKTHTVTAEKNHRIYHDIPDGWKRSYGEWTGDKDAVIEEVMWCDGEIDKQPKVSLFKIHEPNNFTSEDPQYRIYAYKLAKSPAIPDGFTAWNGGECPVAPDTKVEVFYRCGETETRNSSGSHWPQTKHRKDIIAYRVIEKKVIPWTFFDCPYDLRVRRKLDGKLFRADPHPDDALLSASAYQDDEDNVVIYETLAADYLQLDGTVCGTEVEQ